MLNRCLISDWPGVPVEVLSVLIVARSSTHVSHGGWDGVHVDVAFRFLKARKFDTEKTKVMWTAWLKWRKENGIDTLVEVKVQPPAAHGCREQNRFSS